MENALQFPQIIQTSCFAIILLATLVSAVSHNRSAACFWSAYTAVLAAAGVLVYDLVVGNRNAFMPDIILIIVSIAVCRIPFAMYRANREAARDKKNAEPPEVLKRKIEAAASFAFGQHRRLVCERYYLDTPFKVLNGARYENATEHLAHPYVNNFQGAPNIGMFATRPFESAIIGVTVFYQEYLRKFFITVSATYFGKNGKYLENRPILRLCETNLGEFDTVGIDSPRSSTTRSAVSTRNSSKRKSSATKRASLSRRSASSGTASSSPATILCRTGKRSPTLTGQTNGTHRNPRDR